MLVNPVVQIRRKYEKDMVSSDMHLRQMGTAMYFIDRLALRAGHEKDEDEAETVGCCTLKVRLAVAPRVGAVGQLTASH